MSKWIVETSSEIEPTWRVVSSHDTAKDAEDNMFHFKDRNPFNKYRVTQDVAPCGGMTAYQAFCNRDTDPDTLAVCDWIGDLAGTHDADQAYKLASAGVIMEMRDALRCARDIVQNRRSVAYDRLARRCDTLIGLVGKP